MRPEAEGTPPLSGSLALMAGSGEYPVRLIDILAARGVTPFVIAIEGAADPAAFHNVEVQTFRPGQLGRALDEMRRRGVTEVVMLGAMPRPSFSAVRPEVSTVKYLPYFARAFRGGDDHLLSAVVRFLDQQGFTVRGPAEIAPELAAPLGPLGRRQATPEQRQTLERGFALLDTLSPFDVGQAAILADHRVVAIEAAEGTDAMIGRVADLRERRRLKIGKGDGMLVKAPKRGQDLRVDMPAIGPDTLRRAAEAGLSGIGVKAGQVLVGDRRELGRQADRLGLFVEGMA
ncbi:LpxI family protein [Hyphomicrobiales bacterium]|nr:LpxI family protein [Hyphomicrobiales bacterium]CAH1701799.1 LpxI family protein [Hyphomicrobiales bacterium]CAI0345954.1 LpxI family protein [Hyphomicrobiales bacterium]